MVTRPESTRRVRHRRRMDGSGAFLPFPPSSERLELGAARRSDWATEGDLLAPRRRSGTGERVPITAADWYQILRGFRAPPFVVETLPKSIKSPLTISWSAGGTALRFRLWAFAVTHGGKSRDADEFRVQVSSGPRSANDEGGYKDILLGYVPDEDLVVIYDSKYLKHFFSES